MINERLLHRYFPASFTKFLKAPVLKNSVNGCLLFENKPPAPRRSEKITSIDNMKYLSALVLLYQRIFVFYSSLTFTRDLYWPITFQILSNETINSPYFCAPKHWTSQLKSCADNAVTGTYFEVGICEQMEEVVKARNPFHLTQV